MKFWTYLTACAFIVCSQAEVQSAATAPAREADLEIRNKAVNPWAQGSDLLWVHAEALLWQATEENLPFVYTSRNFPVDRNDRDIRNPHFDWNWGYRVGVGYQMPHDGWDMYLMYTRLENHAHGKVHGTNQSDPEGDGLFLHQAWGQQGKTLDAPIVFANSSWRSDLDQFDLNLGRDYFVGKHLSLRPNAGLRTTWLFQKYTLHYENDEEQKQKIHLTNRFWGFGFLAGLDSDWRLGAGFSLYGGVDFSLLLGFFDTNEHADQDDSLLWKVKKSFRSGKPILDMEMGLKWSHLFSQDQMGFVLKAGYEYHLYFQQNQFLNSSKGSPDNPTFKSNGGNLTYQGIALTVQLNF